MKPFSRYQDKTYSAGKYSLENKPTTSILLGETK